MKTPAKVNLFLKITGQRPDGYHTLETVFYPLWNLCDDVTVTPLSDSSGIHLECNSTAVPLDSRNLCWKAADAFLRATQIKASLRITLQKRIPVTAGLGGGSSDAAAVLLELRCLLAPHLPLTVLSQIALSLGADVPFFLNPVPSLATGVGEQLLPLEISPITPRFLLLAFPFPSSTPWAYRHFLSSASPRQNSTRLLEAIKDGQWEIASQFFYNDLEEPVFRKFPILPLLKEKMESRGIHHIHLSGSGPTLFALAPPNLTKEQLPELASFLQRPPKSLSLI